MESRIPIPTDNIFKFYALFGLLLVIFSLGSVLYISNSSNAVVYAAWPELEGLKQLETPSRTDQVRISLLERRLEVNKADKDFYINALGISATLGLFLMIYGFSQWHRKVQPLQDRRAKVELEIAELQLAKLRKAVGSWHGGGQEG
jgi:hypothetical protein